MILWSLATLFVVFGICEIVIGLGGGGHLVLLYARLRGTRHYTSSLVLLVWAWRCLHSEHGDDRASNEGGEAPGYDLPPNFN